MANRESKALRGLYSIWLSTSFIVVGFIFSVAGLFFLTFVAFSCSVTVEIRKLEKARCARYFLVDLVCMHSFLPSSHIASLTFRTANFPPPATIYFLFNFLVQYTVTFSFSRIKVNNENEYSILLEFNYSNIAQEI